MATQLKPVTEKATDNLRIWREVDKTDPAYTKKVNQRGGFTAIAAQYQIKRATETFGPIGEGWGYICGEPIFAGPMIIVPVTMWHGTHENSFGPIFGCAEMLGNRPDHDAPKKAMTDAITKGLSHLGFNADVFLGLYEDSNYIESLKGEFSNYITDKQIAALEALAEEVGADIPKFCAYLKINSLSEIFEQDYPAAVKVMEAKRKAK